MVLYICLFTVAAEIVFQWDSQSAWVGVAWAACLEQLSLSNTLGLRCWTLGGVRLLLTFVIGRGSGGGLVVGYPSCTTAP